MKSPTESQTRGIAASLVLEVEHFSGVPTPDDDEIVHEKGDTFAPWLTSDSTVDVLSLINLKGDSNLQENILTLCTEFKDIFSNELPAEPAKIGSFNLVVEREKWRVPSNRLPSRPQSALKQAELVKESVISYRGNLKRKTELEFQVKWLGYDVTHNSWEPYANLRDSDHLHVFLRQNNLLRLIPKTFR